jgi:hypothetical protein
MMLGLLWIFAGYLISIIVIHGCHKHHKRKAQKKMTNVILITYNSQMQVEWFLRSLLFFSRIKGREIHITVVDEGSVDETLAIIDRLQWEFNFSMNYSANAGSLVDWTNEAEDNQKIVVRLEHQEDLAIAYKLL